MFAERVSNSLPPVPASPSFLRRMLPSNGITVAIVLVLAVWLWSRFSSPTKKAPRRGPLKSATGPRSSTSSSTAHLVPARTASPQLSRRSSAVYGPPRPMQLQQQQQQQQYYQQPSGSGRNSPMRPSFGSSRRMAELANGGYASSSGAGHREQSAGPEYERYEPESYSRPSGSYSSAIPASLGRPPPRPSLARPSPSQNRSTTYAAPPPLSPNPRRRFTNAGPSSVSRGSKRQHEDDERTAKRWKQADGSGEDEWNQMEVDERRYEPRGTKRASREPASSAAKRSRQNDEEDEVDMDNEFELEVEDDESETEDEPQRKRRARDSGSDDGHGSKRAKAGARTKPGSKRDFDDVDSSDEMSEIDDDLDRPHNADSDVGSEDEEAVVAPVRARKDGKRARETRGRRDSNDIDVMDGTMDEPATVSRAGSAPAAKKRTLASRPQQSTPRSRKGKGRASPAPVVVRKPGDEWFNGEGDHLKIGADGVQRKLCEVREIRKKFKMPKDSRHPDRDVTHEVIAEKWLTEDEHKQYVLEGRMAWQPPLVPEVEPVKIKPDEVELSSRQLAKKHDSGIYFMHGTGTPLRSHANLASPSTPLSASTRSPSLSTLVNGRLRLPSSAAAPSPSRSWSHTKAGRLVEDEQKAKMERERRRKASIALGGEPEKVVESAATVERPQEKLKLSDFGAHAPAPVALGSGIKPSPAIPSASLFNSTPSTSASAASKPSDAPEATPSFVAPPVAPATIAPLTSFTPTVTAAPAVSTATGPSFSFPPAKPANEPPKVAASGFQFGPAPVVAGPAPSEPTKAPFSFGAAAMPVQPVEAPKPKTQPNFFGAPAASTPAPAPVSAAQTPVQAAASTFTFGPAQTMPSAPASAAPTPLFGNASAAVPAPSLFPSAAAGNASSMFSTSASVAGSAPSLFASSTATTSLFGGGSTSAPSATPSLFGGFSNTPAQPSLFGGGVAQTGATPASAPSFGFNAPASSTPIAIGFGAPPVAGGFSFNAQPPAAPAPSAAGSPFTFGSTPISFGGAAPAAAPSFAFGSGDSTGGTGTPDTAAASRRRRVRPLPGR